MLNDIISVLVLDKIFGVRVQFSKNWCSLFGRTMLKNALDNAASIWMCTEGVNLARECADYELQCTRLNAFNAFLHNVVAVLIFDAFEHVAIQFTYNILLLFGWNTFECLLNNTTAVHLQCQRQDMTFDLWCQCRLLLGRTEFKELLNDIVAEYVCHETVGRWNNFTEHQLLFGWSSTLQFLLNEPGTMLILWKFNNMIGQVAQLQIRIALVAEIFKQTWTASGTIQWGCDCRSDSLYGTRQFRKQRAWRTKNRVGSEKADCGTKKWANYVKWQSYSRKLMSCGLTGRISCVGFGTRCAVWYKSAKPSWRRCTGRCQWTRRRHRAESAVVVYWPFTPGHRSYTSCGNRRWIIVQWWTECRRIAIEWIASSR